MRLNVRLHDYAYVIMTIDNALNSVILKGVAVGYSDFAALSHGLCESHRRAEVILVDSVVTHRNHIELSCTTALYKSLFC